MTYSLIFAAVIAVDAVVIWGPVIALVTAVTVAIITSRAQIKTAEQATETQESSVLLTGYNQLVAALQAQVADVQSDYNDLRERTVTAEALAAEYKEQLKTLAQKHDREIALLHAEIASLRQK